MRTQRTKIAGPVLFVYLFITVLFVVISSFSKPKKETNAEYYNSITNPDNIEYVNEVAFNMDKEPAEVTQEEFNKRYVD